MSLSLKVIRFTVLVVMCLLCAFQLKAQIITGVITDAESGKAISNVSVYLNGTYQGASTDKEGSFTIKSNERNIPLIVSKLGYQTQTIVHYTDKPLKIILKRKLNTLKEVTIGYNAKSREQEMKIFLREFIGESKRECIISNPDDIVFTYKRKTDVLTAYADQPLLIVNKKLGYKVTYFLSFFKYSPVSTSFQGNYFFTEDTAGKNSADIKKTLKLRDNAYYGSRMHFIRSLWAGNFAEEGFRVNDRLGNPVTYKDIVTMYADQKYLKLDSFLYIDYHFKISNLISADGKETHIALNGFYEPNVKWNGDMSKQRVGEMLPFEFEPQGYQPPHDIKTAATIQTSDAPDSLIKKFQYYAAKQQQGVLFAHFDKNVYTNNENVWFTAYMLNADDAKNSVLQVMLVNDDDKSIMLKQKFVMGKGIAFGNLFLPDSLLSGNYSFMLYTNNVLNGKPAAIFVQPVTIKNTGPIPYSATLMLVDTAKIVPREGRKVLLFTQNNGPKFIAGATVNYFLGDKLHPLASGTAKTDNAGQYQFTIPAKDITLGNNILQAEIKFDGTTKQLKLALPVTQNVPEVKFYPEGGNLADALLNVVGWEVKNAAGVPYSVKGVLYKDNEAIDTISTNGYGQGKFMVRTYKASRYYVKLLLADNKDAIYELPPIMADHPVITITGAVTDDTLRFVLRNKVPASFYVLVHNYKQHFYLFPLKAYPTGQKVKIALDDLPKGLAEVTILDSLQRPLAERVFFAHYNRHNALTINTDKTDYKTRQKINLSLELKDAEGSPITGVVSVACVQANRVTISKKQDIESYYYITHELGKLPARENYLGKEEADKEFLENILLIKGWRRYTWPELSKSAAADTLIHRDSMLLKGTFSHFDRPLKKPVTYIVARDSAITTGFSDTHGGFTLPDTSLYVLTGKKIHLFVNGNSMEYSFKPTDPYDKINQYVNSSYTAPNYNFLLLNEQKAGAYTKEFEHNIQLKQVNITNKANVNGESDMSATGNACGDYYCIYHILNCPNHRGDSRNRIPVKGQYYLQHNNAGDELVKLPYLGCDIKTQDYNNLVDGIYYPMQFYPADYSVLSPSQPDYLSTIYWNFLYHVSPGNKKSINFYTGDITGQFKVIVQGTTASGLVYGEKTFNVNKN